MSSEGDSDRRRFRSRIVGGGEISEGEIPWQVGWAVESRLDCQGGANFTPYLIFVVDNVHGENFSDVEKFHIERKTLKWDKSTYWFLKRIHFLEKLTHWYSNCTNISTELWIKTVILCATTKLLDVLSDQTENQKKKTICSYFRKWSTKVKDKNDRRNSGGTLRQKFNLNDIKHSTFN